MTVLRETTELAHSGAGAVETLRVTLVIEYDRVLCARRQWKDHVGRPESFLVLEIERGVIC